MTKSKLPVSKGYFGQIIQSPWRFKLFLLKKLPMALLAGLKLSHFDGEKASVSVSLNYLTKNPFHSIYFACLAMAAELSTGILAMNAVEQSNHKFSLLVVELNAKFTKKAVGKITFRCDEGPAMISAVQQCLEKREPGIYTTTSMGKNDAGETVAEFDIRWSFKPKD